MSSTIGGGVKPPVTNLPTETDGVSEAKTNETTAPAKTEAKAPVDAMEHTTLHHQDRRAREPQARDPHRQDRHHRDLQASVYPATDW